jgi:membrane-bound lytic murein transglycosylase B
MRLKRVHLPTGSTAARAFTRRTRWWEVISASTVTAFALAVVVTAVGTGAFTAAAQPVGSVSRAPAALRTGVIGPALKPYLTEPLLKAVPVGPGPVSKPVLKVLTSPGLTTTLDASGIPVVALEAYQRAANALAVSDPACDLPWQLLAAIGRVESDNGQFGGTALLPDGNTSQPIYGIPLDGVAGVALVLNTNESEVQLDGGSNYARAVGPMQFLPSTWLAYGADANDDGMKDPNNIFDAALAAADYLCADGGDMANPAQEAAAVLRYNDADQYVRVVLALAASYEQGDYATVPTSGLVGTVSNGAGSTAGTPSSPPANAPAPTQTPTQVPVQTPAPNPTAPSSPATTATPTVNPTATPTGSPSAEPTGAAAATPAPAKTTETGSAPSGQPSQVSVPSATPPSHPGQTVDIGWAPAMRQVVLKLLTAPNPAPTQPVRPTQYQPTQNEPGPTQPSTQPPAETMAPNPS